MLGTVTAECPSGVAWSSCGRVGSSTPWGQGPDRPRGDVFFEMGVLKGDEDTLMVMAEGRDCGQREEKPWGCGLRGLGLALPC